MIDADKWTGRVLKWQIRLPKDSRDKKERRVIESEAEKVKLTSSCSLTECRKKQQTRLLPLRLPKDLPAQHFIHSPSTQNLPISSSFATLKDRKDVLKQRTHQYRPSL